MNTYFAPAERLLKKTEFFAQVLARRYRFIALFGQGPNRPYDELFKVRNEIFIAVRMLIMDCRERHEHRDAFPTDKRREWEATIGWGGPGEDKIPGRLNEIIETIEEACRPTIQQAAP